MTLISVILAGGSGTRLWPLSRKNYPKQFLKLHSSHSLLQETVIRAKAITSERVKIICNDAHYFTCLDQLNEIKAKSVDFILEPCPRNTAPAIALAAIDCLKQYGKDCTMAILPADHLIKPQQTWEDAIKKASIAADQGEIVTFGIVPNEPHTGYGYIQAGPLLDDGVYNVNCFTEKPDSNTAKHFLAQGNYYWNSGMFVFKPQVLLNELKQHAPKIVQTTLDAYQKSHAHGDFLRIDNEAFSLCPADSIDYALMEKTAHASIVPVNLTWSDLGCWNAVSKVNENDSDDNVIQGNVIAQKTKRCFLSSQGQLVTTLGIKDQIIVSTPDAILVADKAYSQQVKDIVTKVAMHNSELATDHTKMHRPWGFYEILVSDKTFKVKHLMVKPGARLSLQLHRHRAEHWVVVSGVADVVNDDKTLVLNTNESTYIPKNTKHRLSNSSSEPLYIVEVQSGDYLGEDDIIRFDDIYQRELQTQ
jgi:mannose-1-phosphate guanylyltransferase / mannose-6-phosphate isomerase